MARQQSRALLLVIDILECGTKQYQHVKVTVKAKNVEYFFLDIVSTENGGKGIFVFCLPMEPPGQPESGRRTFLLPGGGEGGGF